MICLVWVLVLVAVVILLSDARPHKCEQRERSLADLDMAEDSLNRAKDLFPNFDDENESSNSSECSKRDKSIGFIDVALELVSNAKKNIPICHHVPTEDPTTNVTTEIIRPMDCKNLQAAGHITSGVYSVWPRGGESAVRVRCDMDTDGGGWTVIQRRGNFSEQENFDRNWQDYKKGFGNLERDFWLGNDPIFYLSNQGHYSLRMDMTAADGESAYALYQKFRIEDEIANYTLHVDDYSGTAGDDMYDSDNVGFSTKDKDNDGWSDGNCATGLKSGFWFLNCARCNPNGLYAPGVADGQTMHYQHFKDHVGLFSMEMKIKKRETVLCS